MKRIVLFLALTLSWACSIVEPQIDCQPRKVVPDTVKSSGFKVTAHRSDSVCVRR